MITGENGILKRAAEAKEKSERLEIIETAQIDIAGKQIQNDGSLSEKELVEILTSSEYNTKGTLSDNGEESVLDKILTSSDGQYQIPVSEIYNGPFTQNENPGNVLEALKTKISKESEDCAIDEEGNIIPINMWSYQITGEDTCEIVNSYEGDYGTEYYCAYYGTANNGILEYNIPTYIKAENKIYRVNKICGNFLKNIAVSSIVIPNSVTSIGDYAFYNCTDLETIKVPDSITSIGEYAFYECTKLIGMEIPESVTIIGESAFYNCRELANITIPDGVTSIEGWTFKGCTGLTSITIPNSVMNIGSSAFEYCSSLTQITIPNGVTIIGTGAFYQCSGLKNITIPNSITSIYGSAFSGCKELTTITIPNSVEYIGFQVFNSCTKLTNIDIPSSVKEMDREVFSGWNSSQTINVQFKENEIPAGWAYSWNSNCNAKINYLED